MNKTKLFFNGIIILSVFILSVSIVPSSIQSNIQSENSIVLITGFKPFDVYDVNPSELVVSQMNNTIIENMTIKGYVLPVNYTTAPQRMKQLISTFHPELIISLGLAGNAKKIAVEKLAVNLRINPEARFPLLTLKKINRSGPWFHQATYDSEAIVNLIKTEEIPVELSYSAGLYLCNAILYETIHYQTITEQMVPTGFIHLPLLKSQDTEGMSLDTMIQAVQIAIISEMKE